MVSFTSYGPRVVLYQCFMYIIQFNPQDVGSVIMPIGKWGVWGKQQKSWFLKMSKMTNGRAVICTQVDNIPMKMLLTKQSKYLLPFLSHSAPSSEERLTPVLHQTRQFLIVSRSAIIFPSSFVPKPLFPSVIFCPQSQWGLLIRAQPMNERNAPDKWLVY